jgi:hypothetical protein
MNTNVISAIRNLPAQTINSTSATTVTNTGASQPGMATGAALVISVPANDDTLDGVPFLVRLCGLINLTSGACTTSLLRGDGTTTSNRLLALGPAGAPAFNAPTQFSLEFIGSWDSVSKTMNGVSGFTFTEHNRTAPTAALNLQSGISDPSQLQFFAQMQWGVASATNTVQIREFAIYNL